MSFGWFTSILVGLAVLAVLAIAVVLLPRTVRILASRTYCPWVGRTVDVRTCLLDGHDPVSVVSCTAFQDPQAITCGTPCIGGDHRESLGTDSRVAARVGE